MLFVFNMVLWVYSKCVGLDLNHKYRLSLLFQSVDVKIGKTQKKLIIGFVCNTALWLGTPVVVRNLILTTFLVRQ